jgi:recombination protein RecT
MGSELVAIETQIATLGPHFEEALGGVMPVDRLMRTALVSIERAPKLLSCTRQSLLNAIMSAAVLGLEVDGTTGQAFMIPYGQRAQLVIGYKGYNTLGARGRYTITGDVVREGDAFEFEKGTSAFVRHVPILGNKGRIIGAWSAASSLDKPPIVEAMGIDDLLEIKNRSPGAKKDDSPWNDPLIGFPAMCAKTPKRRLARSMPLNVMQLAARMDEAFEEQGQTSHLVPGKGLVIDGEAQPLHEVEPAATPSADALLGTDDHAARLKIEGYAAADEGEDAWWRWANRLSKADWQATQPFHTDMKRKFRKEMA